MFFGLTLWLGGAEMFDWRTAEGGTAKACPHCITVGLCVSTSAERQAVCLGRIQSLASIWWIPLPGTVNHYYITAYTYGWKLIVVKCLLLLLLLWRAHQALPMWGDKDVPKRWGIPPDSHSPGPHLWCQSNHWSNALFRVVRCNAHFSNTCKNAAQAVAGVLAHVSMLSCSLVSIFCATPGCCGICYCRDQGPCHASLHKWGLNALHVLRVHYCYNVTPCLLWFTLTNVVFCGNISCASCTQYAEGM